MCSSLIQSTLYATKNSDLLCIYKSFTYVKIVCTWSKFVMYASISMKFIKLSFLHIYVLRRNPYEGAKMFENIQTPVELILFQLIWIFIHKNTLKSQRFQNKFHPATQWGSSIFHKQSCYSSLSIGFKRVVCMKIYPAASNKLNTSPAAFIYISSANAGNKEIK